jgi:hypothetical protein
MSRMHKYCESKTTRIMMENVRHVTSSSGIRKCQTSWFLLNRGYLKTILNKNPDSEYYNKEVKRLKVKVRKMYNKRKFGQPCQTELKRLSKELLVAKKKTQETFLRSVSQNGGRCWTEFCKYVKPRKGNTEYVPAISDHNSKLITDPLDKVNFLNS